MVVYKSALNPYVGLAIADSHVTVIRPLKEFISPQLLLLLLFPTLLALLPEWTFEDQADGTTKQKKLSTNNCEKHILYHCRHIKMNSYAYRQSNRRGITSCCTGIKQEHKS